MNNRHCRPCASSKRKLKARRKIGIANYEMPHCKHPEIEILLHWISMKISKRHYNSTKLIRSDVTSRFSLKKISRSFWMWKGSGINRIDFSAMPTAFGRWSKWNDFQVFLCIADIRSIPPSSDLFRFEHIPAEIKPQKKHPQSQIHTCTCSFRIHFAI